jgi:hypothetical protein
VDGKGLVRLAQLRGRVATLVRGGRYDAAGPLLGELVRADLALGLPADGLLRARQAAQLAEASGEQIAGPLVVLAATLLAAGDFDAAIDAAALALTQAADAGADRARLEVLAQLVSGAAHRRAGRAAEARTRLDAARGGASRLGAAQLAGLALSELASVDLAEGHAAGAAVCFEFAAEYFHRAADPRAAAEAGALAVTSHLAAGELATATERVPRVADAARLLDRRDLIAYLDGALADAAVISEPDAAAMACALAAESAEALPDSPLARDLRAQARLRQARVAEDALDRARHLEAGIELAAGLPHVRGGTLLVGHLVALVERNAAQLEIDRVGAAITAISRGDAELTEIADMAVQWPRP